jgi:hypothetical protein
MYQIHLSTSMQKCLNMLKDDVFSKQAAFPYSTGELSTENQPERQLNPCLSSPTLPRFPQTPYLSFHVIMCSLTTDTNYIGHCPEL